MSKKCIGCGVELQCVYSYEDGYVNPENYDDVVMCKRCFRLKNYGEYKVTNKSNVYYKSIIKNVFKMDELVLHIVDIFDMGNMDYIYSKIFCPSILVISKIDVLPKSVNLDKIVSYLKARYPKYKEVVLISSKKNYNMDYLYELIMKYKVTSEVYVLGNTNAGKSSFINKMIKNYTDTKNFIITSCMPSTTLNVISIHINEDLILLDTPGIINEGNITNVLSEEMIHKVTVEDEINPRIYQFKEEGSIIIDNIGRIDVMDKSNISVYISREVSVDRASFIRNDKFKNFEPITIDVKKNQDLVIEGLCFIKCSDDTKFVLYLPHNVEIYTRDKFIG